MIVEEKEEQTKETNKRNEETSEQTKEIGARASARARSGRDHHPALLESVHANGNSETKARALRRQTKQTKQGWCAATHFQLRRGEGPRARRGEHRGLRDVRIEVEENVVFASTCPSCTSYRRARTRAARRAGAPRCCSCAAARPRGATTLRVAPTLCEISQLAHRGRRGSAPAVNDP